MAIGVKDRDMDKAKDTQEVAGAEQSEESVLVSDSGPACQ